VTEDLRAAVDAAFPKVRQDLEHLIRIPSVAFPGFDPEPVGRSAELTAEILEASGLGGVRLLEMYGVPPAVFGEVAAPEGEPTILLYAHHDVQPAGDEADWTSPPFEPVERNGRLFGRGSCDDKAGIAMHQSTLLAFGGRPPVGIKVFIEGEEELGSPNLDRFLERFGDQLQADVIVLADATNWRVGVPGLVTRLRGLVDCEVEVRTLDHAVHSGMYGGVFPDALTSLCRILAGLHDDQGNVAIEGLVTGPADPLDLTEEDLRRARSWDSSRSGRERSPNACGPARPSPYWGSMRRGVGRPPTSWSPWPGPRSAFVWPRDRTRTPPCRRWSAT
jgi:acetylornithine deacetylase/succinyl-diaminopimelate desuccinylase-like protein